MHLEPYTPSALAEDGDAEDFLSDFLRQLERQRSYLLKEIRSEVTSEIRSLESLDVRLGWSEEKYVGYSIWNDAGELQGHASIKIDYKIVQLATLERQIRHIRNFLFPEELQMIEEEHARRRAANEERKERFDPEPVSRPRKREKPARKGKK